MNQQQRKYLNQRLETEVNKKLAEIRAANEPAPPFKNYEERAAHLKKLLKGIKEVKEVNVERYGRGLYIVLDVDQAYDKAKKAAELKVADKKTKLEELKNSLKDQIMLGSDAEELANVLKQVADFKVD